MDRRALIYANLLNGVPDWKVGQDFGMSAEDVRAAFRFVTLKIKSYLFVRNRPPVFCDSLPEAQRNRIKLLAVLPKLNLEKEPAFQKVTFERVTADNIKHVEAVCHDFGR